jgi:ABC-type nitrate/sulfonate/bicarbonate transport system permease component
MASRVNWAGLATMAGLVAVWEGLVRSGVLEFQYLPAPSAVGGSLGTLLSSGELVTATAHTLRVTLLGWLVASAVGVTLGLLLGLSETAWRYSMATFEVMRAIPPVTLVPVALLVFGFSVRMELTIIFFVSAWPVLVNTMDGVRGVRPELMDVSRVLRQTRLARTAKITVPAALPSILVGLRLALSLSLVLAVVSEMIGNPSGLGNAVVRTSQALQPEQMFAYVVTIGLLGVGLNAAVQRVFGRLVPS